MQAKKPKTTDLAQETSANGFYCELLLLLGWKVAWLERAAGLTRLRVIYDVSCLIKFTGVVQSPSSHIQEGQSRTVLICSKETSALIKKSRFFFFVDKVSIPILLVSLLCCPQALQPSSKGWSPGLTLSESLTLSQTGFLSFACCNSMSKSSN